MATETWRAYRGHDGMRPPKFHPNRSIDRRVINTKKTLEVLSLLRPIVHDTSKTTKVTWFILVFHWAVDVIEVLYYIRGPVEY